MASRSVVFIRSSQCGVGAPCIQLFTPLLGINHEKWIQSIVLWEARTSFPHEDRLFVKIRLAGWRRVASALPLGKRPVCAEGPPRPGPPSGRLQMAELVSTLSERGAEWCLTHPLKVRSCSERSTLGWCDTLRCSTCWYHSPFTSVYAFFCFKHTERILSRSFSMSCLHITINMSGANYYGSQNTLSTCVVCWILYVNVTFIVFWVYVVETFAPMTRT